MINKYLNIIILCVSVCMYVSNEYAKCEIYNTANAINVIKANNAKNNGVNLYL